MGESIAKSCVFFLRVQHSQVTATTFHQTKTSYATLARVPYAVLRDGSLEQLFLYADAREANFATTATAKDSEHTTGL